MRGHYRGSTEIHYQCVYKGKKSREIQENLRAEVTWALFLRRACEGNTMENSIPYSSLYPSSWPQAQSAWIKIAKEHVQCLGRWDLTASQSSHPSQYGIRNGKLISDTTQWGHQSSRETSRSESVTADVNKRWSKKQLLAWTDNQEYEGETGIFMDASPDRWQLRSKCSVTSYLPLSPLHALQLC